MKCLYLASVFIYLACAMAMPSKVSLSSDEDYGALRQSPEHYQLVLLAPVRNDDHQRHNLDPLRGSNFNDYLTFLNSKSIIDKRSLDSIAGGHLI